MGVKRERKIRGRKLIRESTRGRREGDDQRESKIRRKIKREEGREEEREGGSKIPYQLNY